MAPKTRPPAERFWPKVEVTGFCWNWTGGLAGMGYGLFMVQRGVKQQTAHRWAYEHLVGPIPDGMQLDHLCRNKRCVNPDHLEPVSATENLQRAHGTFVHQFRGRTHCSAGHEYTPENTRIETSPSRKYPARVCKTCHALRHRKKAED